MEIWFFVFGGLVFNLDFVEGIFGNSGDFFLFVNDLVFVLLGWIGYSGCIIFVLYFNFICKVDFGLFYVDQVIDCQCCDGMCWFDEFEFYNEGKLFKLCVCDEFGVIFIIVVDNYFGYCKKEVKIQIFYLVNLFGLVEEEYFGGVCVYIFYNEGQEYVILVCDQMVFDVVMVNLDYFEMFSDGQVWVFDIDDVVLVLGGIKFSLCDGIVSWDNGDYLI